MKPEKALELVTRYADLNRKIKACKKAIGDSIELCNGISGNRNKFDHHGFIMHHRDLDSKGRDTDVHLHDWYTPEQTDQYGYDYLEISAEEQGVECPHCYQAHLKIQERKILRVEFGHVKRAMSRLNSGAMVKEN